MLIQSSISLYVIPNDSEKSCIGIFQIQDVFRRGGQATIDVNYSMFLVYVVGLACKFFRVWLWWCLQWKSMR